MMQPSVLRPIEPSDFGVKTELTDKDIRFHRITRFAYVGCHDCQEFSQLEKDGLQDRMFPQQGYRKVPYSIDSTTFIVDQQRE